MNPQPFIAKWQAANLSDRSACEQHFLDLCDLLDQPKPAADDSGGLVLLCARRQQNRTARAGTTSCWLGC